MTEDKMENGYELWLKCCDNTKPGEVRRFLEVPITIRFGILDLKNTGSKFIIKSYKMNPIS